jgi:Plavaka transposase
MKHGQRTGGGKLRLVDDFLKSCVLKKKTYQKQIPKGGVVAPVILASDKTQLTQFRGDKSAWPVYLTLGNIEKATRRQVRGYFMNRCQKTEL